MPWEKNLGCFLVTLDAQYIPFAGNSFEAVIANHMLYHVPSIESALSEVQRILIPGGCLYAATNGKDHLLEIRNWKNEFFPEEINTSWGKAAESFGLGNGESHLKPWFSKTKLTLFPDQLSVTDLEPIIRYLKSWSEKEFPPDKEARFRSFLAEKLAPNGEIQITPTII
jgi:ubiquinone/menaquinone biosynthesis C-methylase UbiE